MELTYFNPNSLKEADFLQGFVARQRIFDFLLNQLTRISTGGPANHYLIVAPRGFGKTSLLRRIAIGVRRDEHLDTSFIALRFREEQHNVLSLDIFWRNCLQSLTEAREDEGAPQNELDALDAAWARHAPRQSLSQDEQDGEPAWQALSEYCEHLQRRPLLLIDNLDTLLAGLNDRHQWSLRKRLQSENGPILIAAASRYPDATHDQNAAFYEFFRIQPLDKLDDREVFACLRNLAMHRGTPGQKVLTLLEENPGRIAALNTLAGGNPRTLSVLYGVLESDSSADVLSQLTAMLDTFTGWYQARTEELSMHARAVFDALALNWDPMTAAALGQSTGLDTSAVSSHLNRLEKNGYVEQVALRKRGKGRSGYQVSERFFNIWYLMRNGPRRARQSIRFLTMFLQSCYSLEERRSLAMATLKHGQSDPGYALALAGSLRSGQLRQQLLEQAYVRSNDTDRTGEYGPLIDELRKEGRPQRESNHIEHVLNDSAPQVSNDDDVVAFDTITKPALHDEVAIAQVNEGIRFGRSGPLEQAIEVFDNFVARFGTATEATLRERIARVLISKGYALGKLGQAEQEIAVYDDVVARFGTATEIALREQVAKALINKGITLGTLGKSEQEIAVYDDVVARFGTATEAALRARVAKALINKGITLRTLGRPDQALDVYDGVVARFGTATEIALREQVARALISKGYALGKLGQAEQEIAVYDDVVVRFGTATEIALREQVARALINKGITLRTLGRPDQALDVYDGVVARFGTATEIALREQVARALISKGIALGFLDQPEQALEAFDTVLTRFGTATEPVLCERVVKALINKSIILGTLGQFEQEIAVCDDVIARFGTATEPALQEGVVWALISKGIRLAGQGQPQQALDVYDDVVTRFGTSTEPILRERVAIALDCKAKLLRDLGRFDASESAYRAAIELQPTLTAFYIEQGNLLLDFMGQPVNAMAAFENGMGVVKNQEDRAILHTNMAYALALHNGDRLAARAHANHALEDGTTVSPAGRLLLEALPIWNDRSTPDWLKLFEKIGTALSCEDPDLWTSHNDDLQRLLAFIIAEGQGPDFKRWMSESQFSSQYAPLYHAFVAALEGEDHLLQINPETRQPALKIYTDIMHRFKVDSLQKKDVKIQ
ncbi:AAA family ATPase [Burkholderia gladioli]|uniref:AAA family ATPase n=1 Tax=Burkholderia gladioli TaxID=28095 RepID=UPI001641FFDA|nr:AAA family ATPase [Burkholderia gladioli]